MDRSKFATAASRHDNACDCCGLTRRAAEAAREIHAERAAEQLEWAGMEARRPFVASNWQEGDFV